jgi:hypothetical protein
MNNLEERAADYLAVRSLSLSVREECIESGRSFAVTALNGLAMRTQTIVSGFRFLRDAYQTGARIGGLEMHEHPGPVRHMAQQLLAQSSSK